MAHRDNATRLVRIKHSSKMEDTLESVRNIMNVANQEFEATADQYRTLATKDVNLDDLKKYVKLVFAPKPAKSRTEFESRWAALEIDGVEPKKEEDGDEPDGREIFPKVQRCFEEGIGSDLPGVKGTWWGAYNAVTEYLSYERGRTEENRLDSLWFGQSAATNKKALQYAYVMATQ
jgi:hypothetical protein